MPLQQTIHRDKLLSNISVRYKATDLIAERMFPIVPVKKDSDEYRIYERNFKIPETKRANKGLANEHSFDVTYSSYQLERHALKDYISDDDVENYDIGSLRADTTEELTDTILRRMESKVANLFTTTSWSNNVSLSSNQVWTAQTSASNPITFVDTATTTIIQESGFTPNYVMMSRAGFVAAKNHTSILDRTKYTGREMSPQILAGLFGVDEVMVANASYDSNARGVSASVGSIFEDNIAFVGYKPSQASPKKASCGYIFKKNAPLVRRWRVEEREAEAIEVQQKYDAKIVASLSGYLIKDTV